MVYCSGLCPLGTLQDIFIFFANKFKLTKEVRYYQVNRICRYSFLIVIALFFIFGSMFLINLFDPFSLFGKIAVKDLVPGYVFIVNLTSILLEKIGYLFAL